MKFQQLLRLAVWLLAAMLPAALQAQADLPQSKVQFLEKNIRPALVKYCYECHSEESGKTRGGLLLDTREGVMQGGDSGPAIVPGDPDASLLFQTVTGDHPTMFMPEGDDPLSHELAGQEELADRHDILDTDMPDGAPGTGRIEMIRVVLHEGRSAGQAFAHRLHHANQRGRGTSLHGHQVKAYRVEREGGMFHVDPE